MNIIHLVKNKSLNPTSQIVPQKSSFNNHLPKRTTTLLKNQKNLHFFLKSGSSSKSSTEDRNWNGNVLGDEPKGFPIHKQIDLVHNGQTNGTPGSEEHVEPHRENLIFWRDFLDIFLEEDEDEE